MVATNMAVYMADRRKKRRQQLIEMSGGKCIRCGSTNELNFDHKDPSLQKFRLNGKMLDGSWEKILEEWGKCQLLCRPCHVQKTKEDGFAPAWNKGLGKDGEPLPDHGCEASYIRGCRCEECARARHDARVRRGELKGESRGPYGQRGVIKHGTRSGYAAEKRQGLPACEDCRKANVEDSRRRRAKKLAGGISRQSAPLLPEMVSVRG